MLSARLETIASGNPSDPPLESLAEQLLDALAHLHDPTYLQDHPMARFATPEGGWRDPIPGRAVQQYLLDSLEALRGTSGVPTVRALRGYRLLTMRYVEGLDAPTVQARLAIGKSEYYRERQRALAALSALLGDRAHSDAGRGVVTESDASSRRAPARNASDRLSARRLPEADRSASVPSQLLSSVSALTSLVGRERELDEVAALLSDTRLLTLTGMGGVGKTRLALAAVDRLAGGYSDGVWLVELAARGDPGQLGRTIESALGLREVASPTDAALERHLWPRRLLLVLDNCEHLLDGCAELVERLLRRCPRLQILATSREALRIGGETRFRVPSLSAPPPEAWADPEAVAGYEAVRLFVDRARSASPGFTLTPANAASVAKVCWRLDGLPLAVELAAYRAGSLGVEAIAGRLDDALSLLTEGSRTALPRQQTLRATFDWSHSLLDPQEQAVFRRLAVLADGSALETVEAVCQGGEVAPKDVPAILGRLVDKSLVQMEQVAGETRYRLPETVRQYARERLVAAEEGARLAEREGD